MYAAMDRLYRPSTVNQNQSCQPHFRIPVKGRSGMEIWACIGVLSPFPFYLLLWANPQKWVNLCGRQRDPCRILALVSLFLKLIQCATFVSVSTFSWPPPLIFWPFFIFGQFLNFRAYQLLGESGMYYGERFGKSIPWATEAPLIRRVVHVRYCGSMMNLIAFITWVPSIYIILWIIGCTFMCTVEPEEDPTTRAKPISTPRN